MDLKNKKVAIIATTDDMIERFMPPHINYLVKSGASVDCFCKITGFELENLKKIPNVKIHNLDLTRFPFTLKNLKSYKKLKAYFKKESYDLISCMQPVGGVFGRLIGKKFKVKTLYTAHGFHFYKGCPLINKIVYKNIEKYCAKFTDALVTMNEEDFESAKKFKAKKVYKINGIGVDLTKYQLDPNQNKSLMRAKLGLDEDDFVVTSVGELNKNKNTFRLLEVFKNINNPKIKYVICGTGKLKDKFEKYIKKHDLSGKVKLLGFRKDVPEILGISDVYIMPSYREGLSKAMMEAMCYGLPVIASKIRGNVDLLGNNEGGILCAAANNKEYQDAIEKLFENRLLAKKFGERNKMEVKKYSIEIVLDQMKKIYRGL